MVNFFENVKSLGLEFQCFKMACKDEIRNLIVNVEEQYLKCINNNEKLKKYLIHYPFTCKDVSVTVF